MSSYVISDIHGEYKLFMKLLEKIALSERDTLYILGDMIDRGPESIRTVLQIMKMDNAVTLLGNHELMALECLPFLMDSEPLKAEQNPLNRKNFTIWKYNGGESTMREFSALGTDAKRRITEFLGSLPLYREVRAGSSDFVLVHAGLGNFRKDRKLSDYSKEELVWKRADYSRQYFDDRILVTGHTPTQLISMNPLPGKVYKRYNHLAIDCGSYRKSGTLAAVCLDTKREYYVTKSI